MVVFVRMLLALSLACICVCKAGEEGQSHWDVAIGIKHRADRVERKSDDGKDLAENILTGGKRRRRALTQSDRTDSITMINNLRRAIGSSNMPYLTYDVGAENDAASWTSFCNFDRPFSAQGYVNYFPRITTYNLTISAIMNESFVSYPQAMSSVYMTSFGCDLRKCSSATFQGRTAENTVLALCAFKGGSEYDASKAQYKLGEGCTECNSGSFWCDKGLCRDNCAASDSCYCNVTCLNCASTDRTTCRCQCLQGWTGSRCQNQSSMNAPAPTCSTTVTASARTTLTTKSLKNMQSATTLSTSPTLPSSTVSVGTSILQIVVFSIVAVFLRV